ncbi:MAG: helix-turn-helix domain-containing protein [Deltaproteobacteria bacterium]|nr:helix-turn-helix domain-containing protein [Deltaproteobacteria bacterium]
MVIQIAAALDRGRVGRPLTADEVQEIRRLWADGLSLREIGRRLGIAPNTVRRYLRAESGRREP